MSPGRRHSEHYPVANASTASEVAAQQNSLNYALGNLGGRQKSWMTPHQSNAPAQQNTHRPSPRKSKPPKPRPQPQQQAPPQASPIPTRPCPEQSPARHPHSNSTSPQLSNILSRRDDTSPGPSPNSILPSPAPSEEANVDSIPTPTTSNNGDICGFAPPRSLSRGHKQHPYGLPPGGRPVISQTHTPVQASPQLQQDYFTYEDCVAALNQFQANHRLAQDNRDVPRFRVLADAVQKRDWTYLTFHQYYCLHSAEPQSLPRNIRLHPHLDGALRMMTEVLDSNENISPALLRFFAEFPMPIGQIALSWPLRYERELGMFCRFIDLSSRYSNLKLVCQQRQFPPLVRELRNDLGITSYMLQRIVFTATLRSFWTTMLTLSGPLVSEFEKQAEKLFIQSQLEYDRQYNIGLRSPPPGYDDQESAREYQCWGSQFKQLYLGHEDHARRNSLSRGQRPTPPTPQQSRGQAQTSQQPVPASLLNSAVVPSNYAISLLQALSPVEDIMAFLHGQGRQMPPQISSVAQAPLQRGPGRPIRQGSGPSLPRGVPSPYLPVAPPRPPSAPQAVRQQTRFLLPNRGWTQPQPHQPNPSRSALHQAHLRSPILRAQLETSPLYQYVKGFAIFPQRLEEAGERILEWTLSISREALRAIPTDLPGMAGEPPSRIINENSQMYRLRCIKWPSAGMPSEQAWAVADTSWVPYTYFKLNDTPLQPRKKLHHGKDLPMDVSTLIKEGDNKLEIAVVRETSDQTYLNYLVAVEVIGIKSHESIKHDCRTKNYIPASQTIAAIKRRLSGAEVNEEVAIVQNDMTINLFDPWTISRICDIPVRGKACPHYDCFDLNTFLETRKRKDGASAADMWKCPICLSDARPQNLLVDGFLEDVRAKLEQQGLVHTRTIVVEKDGIWKPKAEPTNTNSMRDTSPDEDEERAVPAAGDAPAPPSVDAMVIDLSD
ncbi:hypothetical protein K469DRAFT_680739 [Zopfia rhizophila CBS 207.26]|uniref:SP-RING-type domain-containing protein n=1 Tax=Zopfia rhizophila CBS 207.26 TaxID=1314779 RepID=A0A6A6D621_9PEZI|nr:hypothetical protein K469DRAFT_680739 [Zopfia rhizophila CBS 207.26]